MVTLGSSQRERRARQYHRLTTINIDFLINMVENLSRKEAFLYLARDVIASKIWDLY